MPPSHSDTQFIEFLQQKLSISVSEIAVALRRRELEHDPLPMVLWQYGLISIDQLAQIFDWLDEQFWLKL
jgi:hypothetical protein